MSEEIRILLVEDDADTRTLVEKVLQREGFQVSTASSGEQALQLVAQEPCRFDLVLTDVKLGTMDGVTFAREVWKIRPRLGLAMLSGYRGLGLDDLNGESRLLAYFEKPVYDLRGLANTLKAALQRHRASTPPLKEPAP